MGNKILRPASWAKGRRERGKEIRTVKVGVENTFYPSNRVVTSKYTLWNFLPMNLVEQFRRIANFYFLTISIISFIMDGPVGIVMNILPLAFVVLVTAIKQGYEDFVRHRADKELNGCKVWVLRNACLQRIPSMKVRVGDIVKVCEGENVPCDLVLLASSGESSKCYVTTTGLDGESNLKTLYCPRSLKRNITAENLRCLDATIECQHPTPELYKFNGRIEFGKVTSNIIKRNSLKRQTSLLSQENGGLSVRLRLSDNGSLSTIKRLRMTMDELPDKFRKMNSSSPQLGRSEAVHNAMFEKHLKGSESEPKGHLTLPKRSLPKHQKSLSNVTNVSWDPSFLESVEKLKWVSTSRKFSGKENLVDPLTADNLLLKGSTLKNTEFVFGCAVYTGPETKIALNSKLKRSKFSVAEKSINRFLMVQLGLLIAESAISTILNATLEILHVRQKFQSKFVGNEEGEHVSASLTSLTEDFFLFTIIYNYNIPISLYVTLEVTRFIGALLFRWDLNIRDEAAEQGAICNTSDLNEELGVIEYLFTDKTGTLTENNLRFRTCSINGSSYLEVEDGELHAIAEDGVVAGPFALDVTQPETELFLLALTLCNTVQVLAEGESLRYSSTSPDEKALIEAMQRLDIVTFSNDDDLVVLRFAGENRIYQKLEVLEFSSSRKRMSVIVRDEEEKIYLYCKGAESAVIPRVRSGPTETTLKHVSDFAKKGLRTLVVGYKTLTEEEYRTIEEKVHKARETLSSDREETLSRTYEEIEEGLTLLGATGVEDKLQEDVESTLQALGEAGIKVWMLTGDKVETAVQISLSCGHLGTETKQLRLTGVTAAEECEAALCRFREVLEEKDEDEEFGFVVDGESLAVALRSCSEEFRDVCMKCSAVVCCRLSPMQKSQVVNLVKSRKRPPVVAAIGDGANDVSMIKEAHVGLGIMGKEGRQAVMASDFAFAKFNFLKRVLLVHGHWYYVRSANLIKYFFYKNIVFIAPQFYFFFFSGYSTQPLYDPLCCVCFNTLFTSLPVILYGAFEQNYKDEELLRFPALYSMHRGNRLLKWKLFALWMTQGMWHSLVVFFIPTLFYYLSPSAVANDCLQNFGTTVFHNATILVSFKLLLHSRFWSAAFIGSIAFSILFMFLLTIIYSSTYISGLNSSFYLSYNKLLQSPNYWLLCILIWVIALIPDVLLYVYQNINIKIESNKNISLESRRHDRRWEETVF